MCISIDKYASTARKNILHNLPAQFRISERRSALQPLMNEMANYYYFQSFISAGPSTASPGLQHRNTISPPRPNCNLIMHNAENYVAKQFLSFLFLSILDWTCVVGRRHRSDRNAIIAIKLELTKIAAEVAVSR